MTIAGIIVLAWAAACFGFLLGWIARQAIDRMNERG
jgi:hypothetical protein